ncbi:MAG: hypothetical protein V1709_04345 [Planctomycetota bacterium]
MAIGVLALSAYAEIGQVSIDDIKDHEKITSKLNKIIDTINDDRKDDRQDTKNLQKILKYQLGMDDKIVKKMISKGWVNTHSEVEP